MYNNNLKYKYYKHIIGGKDMKKVISTINYIFLRGTQLLSVVFHIYLMLVYPMQRLFTDITPIGTFYYLLFLFSNIFAFLINLELFYTFFGTDDSIEPEEL